MSSNRAAVPSSSKPGSYDRANVDVLLCPYLVPCFPPDGDVEGVWECPPYPPYD